MTDKTYVVGHCSFANGGGGGGSLPSLSVSGWDSGNPKFYYGLADSGKTAKSFIDHHIERAKQITVEITLKDGRKTKAVIDL